MTSTFVLLLIVVAFALFVIDNALLAKKDKDFKRYKGGRLGTASSVPMSSKKSKQTRVTPQSRSV